VGRNRHQPYCACSKHDSSIWNTVVVVRRNQPKRLLRPTDLHVASWRDAYRSVLEPAFLAGPIEKDRLEVWTARLNNQQEHEQITIAVEGEAAVGFVCVVGDQSPKWGGWVDNLHVSPYCRSKGIGAILLRSAASWIAHKYPGSGMHLWVFEANVRARNFYERLGGHIVEKSVSKIPSAHGAAIFRLHWRSVEELLREGQRLCRGSINQSHRDKKSAAAYNAQNGNLSDSKAGEETEGRCRPDKNHENSKGGALNTMRCHCAASQAVSLNRAAVGRRARG
jgi:ribosomal protein S18 acetylase RimI-like enzyme